MNQQRQASPFQSSASTQAHLSNVANSLSMTWNNAQNLVNYLITAIKEQVQRREALETRVNQLGLEKQYTEGVLIQSRKQIAELRAQVQAKEEQNKSANETVILLTARAEAAEKGWNQCYQHVLKLTSDSEARGKQRQTDADAEAFRGRLLEAEQKNAQMSLELESLRVKSASLENKDGTGGVLTGLTEEQKKQMGVALKKELDIRTQKLVSNLKMAVDSINKSLATYRSRIKELETELEEAKKANVPVPVPPTPVHSIDQTDTTQNQSTQFIFTPLLPPTQDLNQDSVPLPSPPSRRPSPSSPTVVNIEETTEPVTEPTLKRAASHEISELIDLTEEPHKKQRLDTVVPASMS